MGINQIYDVEIDKVGPSFKLLSIGWMDEALKRPPAHAPQPISTPTSTHVTPTRASEPPHQPPKQVNKPFLPLAAQRMSGRMAWALVLGACAMGLAITKLFFRYVCTYTFVPRLSVCLIVCWYFE